MTTNEIEQILERYYDGESTLTEEKLLREYFSGSEVADHLKMHQPLFTYFTSQAAAHIEKEPKVVTMTSTRNNILYVASLAAGVLLVIGLFFTFLNNNVNHSRSGSNDPELQLAFLQAEDALMLVSGNLNNGIHLVQKLASFDKALNDMQRIAKFSQYQPLIINPDETNNQSIK